MLGLDWGKGGVKEKGVIVYVCLSAKFVIITAAAVTRSDPQHNNNSIAVTAGRRDGGERGNILMTSGRTNGRQKTVYRSIINLEHSDEG